MGIYHTLILSTILYTSWRIGNSWIYEKEAKKRGITDGNEK